MQPAGRFFVPISYPGRTGWQSDAARRTFTMVPEETRPAPGMDVYTNDDWQERPE